jgi:hypothetical protein
MPMPMPMLQKSRLQQGLNEHLSFCEKLDAGFDGGV